MLAQILCQRPIHHSPHLSGLVKTGPNQGERIVAPSPLPKRRSQSREASENREFALEAQGLT